MKKQINPTIKAHLIRSAFYVILLLAVCVIPFALAQRNTNKRSVARPKPTTNLAAAGAPRAAVPSTGAATALNPAEAKARQAAAASKRTAAAAKNPSAPASLAGAVPAPHRNPAAAARAFSAVPREPNLSPWNIVANYPLIIESPSVSSDGTLGYSAGGISSGVPQNTFYSYDPVADSWTTLPNLIGGFYDAPSVYAANTNSIYVFGGIDATFSVSNVTQIYNITTGTWSTGANMPDGRYFASGAYYSGNGKIYVIGGFDTTFNEASQTWEYDPIADTWNTSRASIPVAMGGAGYSIVGQNIYLAGHWNGGLASTDHYRYDILADTWTAMAPVPVPIYRPASGSVGTNTYLVGGGNPDLRPSASKQARKLASTRAPATSYTSTYIYDTLSDTWSSGPNTNVAHSFTGGTAIGTKLIVVGGFDGVTGDTNTVELADAGGGGGTCSDYTFALGTATFVPGVDDIGSHCDDCDTPITLPFAVTLYDQTFTTANVGSNGHLTFGLDNATFGITCSPFGVGGTTYAEGPYWGDQCTGACNQTPCTNCGIFTTTTGSAPNRIFYIEWRTNYYGLLGQNQDLLDYEVALYENGTPPFQFIYSNIVPAAIPNDSELVVGVKKDDSNFNQYGCDPSGGQAPPVSSGQTLEATCVGAVTPTPTPTPTCTPGAPQWSEVASLPFASRGPFCVSDGTFYYIGGGYDGTNVHNDLMRYDPVANTYTPLAGAPDQFYLSQAVIFNNKIYSIAGFGLGIQTTTTRIYDIAGNSWTTGTALPEPNGLSDAATGLDSGKIYVACGYNGGASNTLHIYDIATDSWTLGASAPTAVFLPGFGAINGKFYVASGNNGATEVPDLQIYDIATNTWSTGAPVPTPVTGPGCAVFDDGTGPKLYLFGGAAPFPTTITTTQIYDPATNSWSTGPNMVVARLWFYGGALDPSSILAPGGDNSPGIPINDDEILAGGGCGSPTPTPTATATCPPGAPGVAGPWTAGNPYPSTIVRYGFAQTATHFYVFGGVDNGNRVNNVNRMDIATGVWQSRAPMPFTSEAPTCALDASSGIVYCAEGDTGNGFAAYDTAADTWTPLANTPNPNDYGSASGAFNGKVFLAGGTTGFVNTVQVYDIATNTWSAGTSAPDGFLLAGYQQVGQFLYLAGGWTGGAPNGLTTTRRLDMSSAPGVWDSGPAFTPGRSDLGLAYDAGTNTLYALGGDTQGGGFFDSTNEVDELSLSGWPGGTWNPSPPDLPLPVRQANQAGFYGGGDIWSVGGINGTTFQFLNEVWHRNNGGGGCPSPTPTPTPVTPTPTPTPTPVTPTPTPTPTPITPTPTPTPTPTATRPPPTPRPRPTPWPRPTP